MSIANTSAIAAALLTLWGAAASADSADELRARTHIHGLAVDRSDPAYLLIATHHGLYRAGPDGEAELISAVQDFMGFNAHPTEPGMLYASGHPEGGGNLGFVISQDGGTTWEQISPGLNGPVDFHQMTVSPVDPDTIFGVYGAIQVSRDGGRTWTMAGPAPDRLVDLSASAKDVDTLYAARETGLFASLDAGLTWEPLIEGIPVTMVETTPDGTLYAFVYGDGLKKAQEGVFRFTDLAGNWGDQYILHLAVDPTDTDRLFAATGDGLMLTSGDGGATWTPFGE